MLWSSQKRLVPVARGQGPPRKQKRWYKKEKEKRETEPSRRFDAWFATTDPRRQAEPVGAIVICTWSSHFPVGAHSSVTRNVPVRTGKRVVRFAVVNSVLTESFQLTDKPALTAQRTSF